MGQMEMRWLVRNGWGGPERVLQYREGHWFRPATFPDDGLEWRGTEWTDVPEVRE